MRWRIRAEDRPADHHNEQRGYRCDDRATAIERLAQEQAVEREEQSVVGAPQHEVPARAVPEPGQQETDPEIEIGARIALAVAPERFVEIVADPCRQRDVPAPPELRDR